jgi:two-component system OmpR family sensor kinase
MVITVILGSFSSAVYWLVAHDRNQQLNEHLRQVANTSSGTLGIIRHEYEEMTTEDEYRGYIPSDDDHVSVTLFQLMGKYRAETIAELVPNPISPDHLGVEWFDSQQQVMVTEGSLFPETSLPPDIPTDGILLEHDQVRSFILPVYSVPDQGNQSSDLLGYVRANESTVLLEAELERFRGGLALGVLIVSSLVSVGGIWLTRESLKPILQSFEQLKQFTSDASHELRNPLTAIRASVSVMQSHPERVHPADSEKLKAIASASFQMSQLVDDLLLLTRIDRQIASSQEWRILSLDEMLEDLVNLYQDQAKQKQISLTLTILEPLEVSGDANQLQRLFTNLLANALQYTPFGGKVHITLECINDDALIRIEDSGIGIASEQLPYIFDRFWRVDPSSQHHNGSGLGLAIAQGIVQQHQGEISVKSAIGQGSCFQVKLAHI